MNKILKKVTAGILSSMIFISACLSTISASAAVIGVSGSKLTYTITTEKVTYNNNPNSIKMTIRVVNNPGIYNLDFGVQYSGNCEAKNETVTPGLDCSTINDEINAIHLAWMYGIPQTDYFGDLEYVVWFEEEDSKGHDTTDPIDLDISVGLTLYSSYSEDKMIDKTVDPSEESYPVDTIIPANSDTEVLLGDVNDNDVIDQLDAQTTLSIVSYNNSLAASGISDYVTGMLPVDILNMKIATRQNNWHNKFPKLKYAEVADVNFDNLITNADAQAILTYHSNAAVGNIDMDSVIGKPIYVNVQA